MTRELIKLFIIWIELSDIFPKEFNGKEEELFILSEHFYLWLIISFDKTGNHRIFTDYEDLEKN